MEKLLNYVETCASDVQKRIEGGRVPSCQQLNRFAAGMVTTMTDFMTTLQSDLRDRLAGLWWPQWDFDKNSPGLEREDFDLRSLLQILQSMRQCLRESQFDSEPLRAYVNRCGSQINQRMKEGKIPSKEQLDGFVNNVVREFKELLKDAPSEITDATKQPWTDFWDFEQNCSGPRREMLDVPTLLGILRSMRESLQAVEMQKTIEPEPQQSSAVEIQVVIKPEQCSDAEKQEAIEPQQCSTSAMQKVSEPQQCNVTRLEPPKLEIDDLRRTETIGMPLPLDSEDDSLGNVVIDDCGDYPCAQWKVPEHRLRLACKGDSIESSAFKFHGVDCELKLRFWPKGLQDARSGYCSVYVQARDAVKMQLEVGCNRQSQMIDPNRAVEWKAGGDRGYQNFCPSPDGEVTLKVTLLAIGPKVPTPKWELPDQYELGRVLGTGAYGSVREGRDVKTGQDVAIKRMELRGMSDGDVERIRREVQILKDLDHSHITKIHDAVMTEGNIVYIIMEKCETDLARVCGLAAGLSMPQARRLAYNLCVGCNYLHSKGVYHRDLKPANCLANRDCSVKICDFNLSKVVDTPQASETLDLSIPQLKRELTRHVVSRWYRPPEVILKLAYSEAIDVWSVGCIIGELLRALNTDGRCAFSKPLFPGTGSSLSRSKDHGDQLDIIIGVLGTPFEAPEFAELSEMTQSEVRFYRARKGTGVASLVPKEAGSEAVDLLVQMLTFFPQVRIRMVDALHHSFFQRVRRNTEAEEAIGENRLELHLEASLPRSGVLAELKKEVDKVHSTKKW